MHTQNECRPHADQEHKKRKKIFDNLLYNFAIYKFQNKAILILMHI